MIIQPGIRNSILTPNARGHRDYAPIVFDDEIQTYTPAEALCNPTGNRNLWNPDSLWQNGRTVWVYQGSIYTAQFGQVSLVRYDEGVGYDGPHIIGRPGWRTDGHNVPAFGFDKDDNVWIIQEYTHDSPYDVYKVTFNPSTSAVRQTWTIGNFQAYPNVLNDYHGGFIIWNRQNNLYDAGYLKSPSGFVNWGNKVRVSDSDNGPTYPYRHYEASPRNYYVNGRYYLTVSEREDYGEGGFWKRSCLLITSDFVTFENASGSFSKNILVSGAIIGTTELDHYEYWEVPTNKQSCIPVSCVSNEGDFYTIHSDGNGNDFLIYFYEGAWHTQGLTIANLADWPTGEFDQENAYSALYVFDHNNMVVIAMDNAGKNRMYTSTDVGVTWTDNGLLFPEVTGYEGKAVLPRNIFEIPNNRNFMVGCSIGLSEGSEWDEKGIALKKAAFGTIQ